LGDTELKEFGEWIARKAPEFQLSSGALRDVDFHLRLI
jgi:hypothetical protein